MENEKMKVVHSPVPTPVPMSGSISDGFHTFDELYAHRMALTLALFKALRHNPDVYVWRSLYHSDGSVPFGGGWFVTGIIFAGGSQITYHYPYQHWNLFEGNNIITLPTAPVYDGHSSQDVINRLTYWASH